MTNYLSTDLYQLTMADAYLHAGLHNSTATFDLFVRKLPKDWTYLIACGLDEAITKLADFHFTDEDLAYIASTQKVSPEFVAYLKNFRFRGHVRAVEEGMPVLADEPLLEVTGNLIETQLVETFLLSMINYQTLIATKAHKIVLAAGDAKVVDFGLRRAPGPEAGLRASRAAYIAGMTATSNVEAGLRYNIPIVGTHAHAFVQAFPSEYKAFKAWCARHSEGTTLLIDTYNVARGAENACKVANEGAKVDAVRIDSGDLAENAKMVRGILDANGLQKVKIIATNDLNEIKIATLREAKAPIDSYGVGTDLVTARPEAALGGVYKLVELDGKPRVKLSTDKHTWPGRKELWRHKQCNNDVVDTLSLVDEKHHGVTLLRPSMKWGTWTRFSNLAVARTNASSGIPVSCTISDNVRNLLQRAKKEAIECDGV